MDSLSGVVREARDGPDRSRAFAEIVRRFQDMAVGSAYATVGDWQRAQDIAQEAFLEAWLHLGRLEDVAAFPGWFRRIVVGKCGRELRRRAPHTERLSEHHDLASATPAADMGLQVAEQRDLVARALSALPDDERLVAVLHYIAGHTYGEIGAFVGVPVTTVDHRLRRARKRLRETTSTTLREQLFSQRPSRNGGFGMSVKFVTQHPDTLRVIDDAKRLGATEAPILVVGEAGTGKVVIARLVHEHSARRDAPLVLTKGSDVEAFEGQLFGVDGDRPLARDAEGGALAVDFGHRLPRALQTRLLRLIRSGEYRDDNTGEERQADVRVMALTNRALEDDARDGAFDAELLARFEGGTIRVAPLRERTVDIPGLTDHFLETRTAEGQAIPALAAETLEALLHHSWPNNVRGLMEAMDHALLACDGSTLLPDHLPTSVRTAPS